MQAWFALGILVLVLVLFLLFRKHSIDAPPRDAALEGEALRQHIRAQAAHFHWRGAARIHPVPKAVQHIRDAYQRCGTMQERESLLPAAQWLVDNVRMLEEAAVSLDDALCAGPLLPASHGEARVSCVARELVAHMSAQIDTAGLTLAVTAWQEEQALTEAELWALPLAIRRALVALVSDMARECALAQQARRAAEEWAARLAQAPEEDMAAAFAKQDRSFVFLERLLQLLLEQENAAALSFLDARLLEMGLGADQVAASAHEHQAHEQLWMGNAVTSLRTIGAIDWRSVLEGLSATDTWLRQDPAQVYQHMDEESRSLYRQNVARVAQACHAPEPVVARRAVECAQQGEDALTRHVGYYLLDMGVPMLYETLGGMSFSVRARRFFQQHACTLYIGGAFGLTFVLWALLFLLPGPRWLWFFTLLPLSEAVRQTLNHLITRFMPPRRMPRIAPEALTLGERTLVVVPTLLTSRAQALEMVRHLSVLRFANPEPMLEYMLLGDFADGPAAEQVEDADLLRATEEAVLALNQVWGGGFYFVHRKREWDGRSERFMGYERKRGALMALNAWLLRGYSDTPIATATADPASLMGRFRYVITLDADTKLPPGSALSLVGLLAHPLNAPQKHWGVERGFAVIQPRMEVAASTVRTRLARLYGGEGGVDPYVTAFSDVYQNLCGEGSFAGKGIYDLQAFTEATEGRIRPGTVLSHDLLEGSLSGSALACDTTLFDGQPASLHGWMKRLHRWTRGDWQLLPWLLPNVKGPEQAFKNPLSALSRFKVYENLRRSLIPAASLLLLLLGIGAGFWPAVVLAVVLPHLHVLIAPSKRSLWVTLIQLCLWPYEVSVLLDAVFRTVWRVLFSRKHLLEWVTSADAEKQRSSSPHRRLWAAYAAAGLTLLLGLIHPYWLLLAIPLAGLWLAAPMLSDWLDGPAHPEKQLTEEQRDMLQEVARETWTFFEKNVIKETNYLPPDNTQLDPPRGVAMRTSPTNIGMYLLSCVSAQALGILDADEMTHRIQATVSTLEKMETWHGHLYNWYDLRTLAPMKPRYISAVDGGNLAICLLATAQAVRGVLAGQDQAVHDLPARLEAFADGMDFSLLFDPGPALFYIGIDADSGNPSTSHYDLLASEARLLSFLAVMRREVPLRHWQRLGRTMTATSAGATLLSWGGTMFEYLMPALLLRQVPGTLLGDACKNAAEAQMQAHTNMPWGVSESGFWAFDPGLFYQYRAFGLPQLALSSTAAENVIAPYASALALHVLPSEAAKNLATMRAMGWCGEMGFYEAADYSTSRIPADSDYQLVRSHMSHHQGMAISSICNALCDMRLVKLFHSLPQVEAYTLLLEERRPTQRMLARAVRPQARNNQPARPQQATRQPQPSSLPLETQLLYGGGTTMLCDARGGGYIAHRGLMLTRWRPDPLLSGNGFQCYVKFGEKVLRVGQGGVTFESGRVVYRLREGNLGVRLACGVSPIDGAAVYILTLQNHGDENLTVEACSFFEVALSAQAADVAHPAFRNLSIETSRMHDHALVARRRPRTPSETFPLLVHALGAVDAPSVMAETDRAAFLSRTTGIEKPAGITIPFDPRFGTVGAVVDPCMSLRARQEVPAGKKVRLSFVVAAVEDEEKAEALATHYLRLESAQRALELGATQADVVARYLGLDGAAQNTAQRLASYLLYTGQPAGRMALLSKNRQGMQGLWSMGISGDLPILVLRTSQGSHMPLARMILRMHEYLRQLGLWFDLVMLGSQGGDYHQPVRDVLRELIASSPARELVGKPGGVFLLDAQAIGEGALDTLLAASALVLQGDAGSLASQLAALRLTLRTVAPNWPKLPRAWDAPELPKEEFLLHNGFGGFDADGAYVIDLHSNEATPAPWCNVLANPSFGTILTERGSAFTWAGNSNTCRLTPFANDAVRDQLGEALYLRDEETGEFWSVPHAPCNDAHVRIRHGQGYSRFETRGKGFTHALTVFVDKKEPMKYMWLQIKNDGPERRTLSLTAYARWVLGSQENDSRLVTCGEEGGLAWARRPALGGFAWLTIPGHAVQVTHDRLAFIGEGDLTRPRAMRIRALDTVGGESPCAALRTGFTIAPGETFSICTVLGFSEDLSQAKAWMAGFGAVTPEQKLDEVRRMWRDRLGVVQAQTPSPAIDLLLNRWLPYQVTSSRLWARAGFYQAGGAIGYRDQLQDMLSLLHADPQAVRAHLLAAAAHQFEDGDVQHWWHPPARGVRTLMSDDKLFLPYVTALYCRTTGDETVLHEKAPYLRNHPILEGAEDWYGEAEPTDWAEPLHAHCLRAIHHVRLGEHGLPLIGTGDWNDALNHVGPEGKGESVWLGFFFAQVLSMYAPYCNADDRAELEALRLRILAAAENEAWDGAWYRRAWFDDGTPIGSRESPECRIDVIAQSWAALAGAPEEHAAEAMRQAMAQLVDEHLGIIKLLTPPFDGALEPGYIRGYLPGVRENGGQYTHAAAWTVLACLKLGWTEDAWRLYQMLLPTFHGRDRESALQYRVEPYVVAADVYANSQQAGRGGWTWYTGSAAWLYLAGVEGLLGLEKCGTRLRLNPTLPADWPGFAVHYQWGKATYVLRASRDADIPRLDGQPLSDGWIDLVDDGLRHESVWPVKN